MSIEYCDNCDKHIDTDFNAEHWDEEHALEEQTEQYGGFLTKLECILKANQIKSALKEIENQKQVLKFKGLNLNKKQ